MVALDTYAPELPTRFTVPGTAPERGNPDVRRWPIRTERTHHTDCGMRVRPHAQRPRAGTRHARQGPRSEADPIAAHETVIIVNDRLEDATVSLDGLDRADVVVEAAADGQACRPRMWK